LNVKVARTKAGTAAALAATALITLGCGSPPETTAAADQIVQDSLATKTTGPLPVAERIVVDSLTGERSLTVKASAYNSVAAQTDSLPNEGAWGDTIEPGMKIIAVSPDLLEAGLERGTEVAIDGLEGRWTVRDRTASRMRNRIDIYMGVDVDAAVEWGIRDVTIRWSE